MCEQHYWTLQNFSPTKSIFEITSAGEKGIKLRDFSLRLSWDPPHILKLNSFSHFLPNVTSKKTFCLGKLTDSAISWNSHFWPFYKFHRITQIWKCHCRSHYLRSFETIKILNVYVKLTDLHCFKKQIRCSVLKEGLTIFYFKWNSRAFPSKVRYHCEAN